jgi:hypothetical protein
VRHNMVQAGDYDRLIRLTWYVWFQGNDENTHTTPVYRADAWEPVRAPLSARDMRKLDAAEKKRTRRRNALKWPLYGSR